MAYDHKPKKPVTPESSFFKDKPVYHFAGGIETWGERGAFGVEIWVAGVPVKDNEKLSSEASHHCHQLRDFLIYNKVELDPETKEKANQCVAGLVQCFAGHSVFVERLPNGYWSKTDFVQLLSPWLKVTTSIGHIRIGWRKRVIEMDWSETVVKESADDLFPDENVTKDDKFIHADSYEKATEYIAKLFSVAGSGQLVPTQA